MKYCRIVLVLTGLACLITCPGWAQTSNDKYIDLIRKDLRKEKQSIVDQAMALDAAKKSQFWAIYADYQTALDAIWDQRIVNITKYADNIDKMTDEIADQLAVKMMDLEGQRAALRNKYYKLYKEKMGTRTAARFLQVESSLASLIDLQLASEIPILQ
jgi:malate synthase